MPPIDSSPSTAAHPIATAHPSDGCHARRGNGPAADPTQRGACARMICCVVGAAQTMRVQRRQPEHVHAGPGRRLRIRHRQAPRRAAPACRRAAVPPRQGPARGTPPSRPARSHRSAARVAHARCRRRGARARAPQPPGMVDAQIHRMQQAEHHEGQCAAVPDAGQADGDHGRARRSCAMKPRSVRRAAMPVGNPRAARRRVHAQRQRVVEIQHQPAGQRHVPALPVVDDALRRGTAR